LLQLQELLKSKLLALDLSTSLWIAPAKLNSFAPFLPIDMNTVVARRLLGFSSGATTEMSGYLMAVGMSWGMAGALYERAHVRIDVLIQKFPLRWRTRLHLFSLTCLLVAVSFFVWGSFSIALDSWTFGSTDLSSMRVPLIIPQGLF
jgi:TRAP-type C4-dicarboxylate transport system permease small subunit